MEARAAFGKSGISKLFVGVVLILVAVGLGIMAAYLAANVSGASGASQPQTNSAPKVLRQDNWNAEQAPAAVDGQPTGPRHGGIQE
jgi:hypothetical protein